MKHNLSLDHISQIISDYYRYFHAYASFIRGLLVLPLIALCSLYTNFINLTPTDGSVYVLGVFVHPWGLVLSFGAVAYCFSILLDIFVALSNHITLKCFLGKVSRFFRVFTYFYVGATIANFTYRSYASVGFDLPLHLLLIISMGMIITLIFFHAYQCREGLENGGKNSEIRSW